MPLAPEQAWNRRGKGSSTSKLVGITLALSSLLSGPASALTIAPNPIPLVGTGGNGGSIAAAVELMATASGIPAGGVLSFGSVAPTDTTLIFRITLDPSSDPVAYFAVSSADTVLPPLGSSLVYSGAGVIPGSGTDFTLLEITADPSVVIFGVTSPGSVSDLFFVSYPTPPAVGEFLIAGVDDGPASVCGHPCVYNSGTVVPEPETLMLLGLCLAALGAQRRWRSRASLR